MEIKHFVTRLIGKVLYNISDVPGTESWEERAVIFRDMPDEYVEDDMFKGWIRKDKKLVFYCPDMDFQQTFLPLLPSNKEKPVPFEITFCLKK